MEEDERDILDALGWNYEGIGWVPIDMSYGKMKSDDPLIRDIYKSALDQYRLVIVFRPFARRPS